MRTSAGPSLQAQIDNATTVVRCRERIAELWPNQPRVRELLSTARAELRKLTDQQLVNNG